jgi:hypothetical protein
VKNCERARTRARNEQNVSLQKEQVSIQPARKSDFYHMARRSATECASIFDECINLKLIEDARYSQGRELLVRLVAMLTKMAHGTN